MGFGVGVGVGVGVSVGGAAGVGFVVAGVGVDVVGVGTGVVVAVAVAIPVVRVGDRDLVARGCFAASRSVIFRLGAPTVVDPAPSCSASSSCSSSDLIVSANVGFSGPGLSTLIAANVARFMGAMLRCSVEFTLLASLPAAASIWLLMTCSIDACHCCSWISDPARHANTDRFFPVPSCARGGRGSGGGGVC